MSSTLAVVIFWTFTSVALVGSYVAGLYYTDIAALDFVTAVGVGALAALWYEKDSLERELVTPRWFGLFVFLAAAIAVPIYLLRYRGWKDGGLALLKIVGLAAGVFGLVLGIGLLLYPLTG